VTQSFIDSFAECCHEAGRRNHEFLGAVGSGGSVVVEMHAYRRTRSRLLKVGGISELILDNNSTPQTAITRANKEERFHFQHYQPNYDLYLNDAMFPIFPPNSNSTASGRMKRSS
jgi:hypothetical protein